MLLAAVFAVSMAALSEAWAGEKAPVKNIGPGAQKLEKVARDTINKMQIDFINESRKERGEKPIVYNPFMSQEELNKLIQAEQEKEVDSMMNDFADALENF